MGLKYYDFMNLINKFNQTIPTNNNEELSN